MTGKLEQFDFRKLEAQIIFDGFVEANPEASKWNKKELTDEQKQRVKAWHFGKMYGCYTLH